MKKGQLLLPTAGVALFQVRKAAESRRIPGNSSPVNNTQPQTPLPSTPLR